MAYVEPAHSVYKSYLLGEPSLSTSGGQTGAQAQTSGLNATASSTQTDTGSDPTTQVMTQGDGSPLASDDTAWKSNQLYDPAAGNLLMGFLSPYQERIGKAQGQLGALQSEFQQGAGSSRTFEGIGGAATLGKAINPNTMGSDRTQALNESRNLLGAKYEGPTGLDPTKAAEVKQEFQNLGALAGAMQTGGGLQTALKMASPSLTAGEAKWQARNQFQNTGWRDQWVPQWAKAEQATKEYGRTEKESADYAAKRAEEESAISNLSREFLTGRRDEVQGDLQKMVAEAEDKNRRIAQAYEQMKKSGTPDWSLIQGVEDNPYLKERDEAAAKYGEIMGKYGDVTDVPLLGKTTWNGNEYWLAPGADFNSTAVSPEAPGIPVSPIAAVGGAAGDTAWQNPAGHGATGSWAWNGQDLTNEQVNALVQRQRELDALFQPYSQVRDTYPNSGINTEDLGEYADVFPLYFGTPYEPGDITDYINLEPGSTATPGAFANEGQRFELNTIADLLGDSQELAKTDPFQVAKIVAEMDGFLQSERNRIAQQGLDTDANVRAYSNQVQQAGSQIQKWLREHPEVKAVLDVTA